jgi:hypothetical protein
VFTRARDALFKELLDALLVQPGVRSFTELCLAGTFRRQWPSLYAAIQDGRLDQDALERFLAAQVPAPGVAVYALDTALWPHPQAKTLADRQLYPIHGSGLGDADAPLTPHGALTFARSAGMRSRPR